MAYGSYPYGSTPYGGLAGAQLVIDTQALTLTLQVPVWIVKHSNPATFALGLTILNPTVKIVNSPSLQTLTLTQQAAGQEVRVFPALFTLSLTQQAANVKLTTFPATQTLTVDFGGPEIPVVGDGPALFNTNLTLHQPSTNVGYAFVGVEAPFKLNVYVGFNPKVGSMQPRIVRYIKDPIRTGGCPQCGTFMYHKGAVSVRGESIRRGRNFETSAYRDDKWLKCGRCGWTLHPDRSHAQKEESQTGWGLRYDEIRADADGDA